MASFKIVFRDGYSIEQEAENFSMACVLAAHERLKTGARQAVQLLIAEENCLVILKENYCDKDGKCTAADHDELIACRFYVEEKVCRPGMCITLSRFGDNCLHPDALTVKLKAAS